ncbi:MAG: adenylate/guanylate cyclase domain-containing protein [Sneathiella sp.]|uniref:adenylate/guanylate cyclase domain-containing protein n=1 Tax=Sneathiella sp. TaxID=1964365 RepID=UPI0030032A8B
MEKQHSLKSEELAAQKTAMIGRSIALLLIAPLVTFLAPWPGPIFIYILLIVFLVLGWAAWRVANSKWGKPWHQYLFVTVDFMLMTVALLYPNPFVPIDYPPQFTLRYGSFIFYFVLLTGLVYVYQPRLVLWGGLSAAASWSVAIAWLISLPDTIWRQPEGMSVEATATFFAQPTFIDIDIRTQEIVVLLIVAGLLALAVRRSRMIALRQARLARERENLGRYFPRKTAQMLADRSDPFSTPSEHDAAVLFADLVGFTTWSDKHTPGETIELLREVHGLLAQVVFHNDGTLDKFIGDGMMATFGTPEPSERDASSALAAMIEMVEKFEILKNNSKLLQSGNLELAVGIHYGPIVMGNIGSEDRLEFAVLGDTVNVASRLEGATRQVGCRGLASSALIDAANKENHPESSKNMTKLERQKPIMLRGLSSEMLVFKFQ